MEISRQIQVQEAAFRYGEGFFTTMRIKQSRPLWLAAHIQRLNHSLQVFKMPGLNEEVLLELGCRWPIENHLSEGFLRIIAWQEGGQAHVNLEGGPLEVSPQELKLTVSEIRRHSSEPLLHHKSLNYWNNNLVYRDALQNGFDEAIVLNEKDEITEGSRNNVFWVKGGILFTPQINCGLLPGIARKIVIELAARQSLEVQQGCFQMRDLLAAEEVFLSNSVRGIREVVTINAQPYQPGRITRCLQELYAQSAVPGSIG